MSLHVVHVDCDCFFAAVEMLDHPELRGKPVIVGGRGSRGVVATCSYEARKYGVRSAMPMFLARQKCPHGIYVPTRRKRYVEVSRQIFRIFRRYTSIVEPVSIDEAYLDFSHYGDHSISIARRLKQHVKRETGITLSVGVAPNKFLAKLASDLEKPDGFTVIHTHEAVDILRELPVRKLRGVGPKTEEKMHRLGIYRVKDLYAYRIDELRALFGKHGEALYYFARGEDHRPIQTHRERKSVSRETTFATNTRHRAVLERTIRGFAREIAAWLTQRELYGRTVTVKVKDANFVEQSRSRTVETFVQDAKDIERIALLLLTELNLTNAVRLVGVGVANLERHPSIQLSMFDHV